MSKWFKRIQDRQEGITLIELIVVVAIIGVLAWLITPRVLATLNTSKVNSAESVANELLASVERHAAENTGYPAAIATWEAVATVLDVNTSANTKIIDTTTFKYFVNGAKDQFCISFTAMDKDSTIVEIRKTGVKMGGTACVAF